MTQFQSLTKLTPRQSLIWMENRLTPDLPANVEVCFLTVSGALDHQRLRASHETLQHRHDIFRSRLIMDGDEPAIEFVDDLIAPLEFVSSSEANWRRDLAGICAKPFADGEPLARTACLSLSDDRHILAFIHSHIVTDGWTIMALFRQWAEVYAAPSGGDEANGFAYLDALSGPDGSGKAVDPEAETFWAKQLAEPAPLASFYGQTPTSQRGGIHRVMRDIDDTLSERLDGRASGYSPSLVMAAVCASALYRVSNDEVIALGVPLLNRAPDEMDVAGLFMEVAPNRLSLAPEMSFRDLIQQAQAYAREIKPYRGHTVTTAKSGHEASLNYYPNGVDEFAGLPAELTCTTALELGDAFPSAEGAASGGGGLTVRIFRQENGRPRDIGFDFDEARWPDRETHERFASHFMALLEAFDQNPDARIGEIDILTDAERAAATASSPGDPFPDELPNVAEIVFERAKDHPDKIAVSFQNRALTYAELANRVDGAAGALARRGVKTGDLVAVCMTRSENLVVALLAVMRAGGAYVPLDPMHPESRLQMIVEDAAPVLMLADAETKSSGLMPADKVLDIADAIQEAPAEAYGPSGDIAYVIFTSGSTGRPKGVRVKHRGLITFLHAMAETPGMDEGDKLLSVTTVSFDIAALELFLPLLVGGSVHLASYEEALDGEALARLMVDNGISIFQATPATYRMLAALDWQNKNIKALCGGEAMPNDLAERLFAAAGEVWNMYGPTETTIWSSVEKIEPVSLPVTIGRPIRGTAFTVRTPLGALTPPGAPGELNISGEGVAAGYHERDDLTADKFIDADNRRYRTGDAVRFLPDGRVKYIGRIDFQVKVRGFRIELGEIENQIGAVAGVDSAAVIPFTDASGETALAGFYSGREGEALLPAIRDHLAQTLPAYMRPASLTCLEEFPLNSNGKIDRKQLQPPALDDAPVEASAADFVDDIERSLADVWSRVLGRGGVGPDSHFFDMGGHSIMALTLVKEIQRATGVKLDLGAVFADPVLRDMATRVRNNAGEAASALVSLQPKGEAAPLFCICGVELYRDLAVSLGEERPVYGVYVPEEAQFLEQAESGDIADISTSALAESYKKAILRAQPEGPYLLTGVSFGGLLALEMAQQMEADGHEVAKVVLIDTIRKDSRWIDRNAYIAAKMRKLLREGPAPMAANVWRRVKKRMNGNHTQYKTAAGDDALPAARLREIAFIKAMESHDGVFDLKAPVVLIKAQDRGSWGDGYVFADDYGWGQALGKNVEVIEVWGDHLGVLKQPHVRDLAAKMSGELL